MDVDILSKKQLDDLVECSICSDVFDDPRSLPCTHSYCFKCIANWCRDKKPGDKVACPLCRNQFAIPDGGVVDLPTNFFIGKLLTLGDKYGNATKTPPLICDSDSTDNECNKHRNEPLKFYCHDCLTVLCTTCYDQDHNTHSCSDVEPVAAELRVSLTQDLAMMTSAIRGLEEKQEELRSRKSNFLDQVNKVQTEICERADRLKAIIDDGKRKLIAELLDIKTGHEKQMDCLREEISQTASLLESLKKSANEILTRGSACDITRHAHTLRMRTEQLGNSGNFDGALEDLNISDVSLSTSNVFIDGSKNILGEVVKQGVETPTFMQALSGLSAVTAIANLNDQLFVTRSGVAQVSVYVKTTLQLQRQLTFPGLGSRLWGLATCSTNNYLYVSDFDNHCLHRIDVSLTKTTCDMDVGLLKWNVANNPRGLSVCRSCNVLVAYYSQQIVQEYTPSGSLVREISDGSYLWQAVELESGTVAISRDGPVHGIAMVSLDGQVIHSYGSQGGSGIGHMNHPRSLAVDKHGCILIADRDNHRILAVNPTFTASLPLPLPIGTRLKCPREVSLDREHRRLYVGEGAGQNRLLVFENVANIGAMFAC